VLPALRSAAGSSIHIVLPRLQVVGLASNAIAANVPQGWAMNVANGAVTRFTNYPFRTFVRFENNYYGVGMSGGLYKIGGDLDVDKPIAWDFETGLDDLDNPAQKGILGVYVDGVIEKGAELTIITDTRARYTYTMYTRSHGDDYRPYRVECGRGIRTRNVGIAMSSTVGGYVEVNQIAPKFVISKRSV
jgi:hypothetical protein